ncbi:hypothetical protein HY218_00550 [Candidatus Saccharibacteria bacterium]|nr:hypothetical protein [Candidatus Saccharibacteria bacterium]
MGERLNIVIVGQKARDDVLASRLEGCQINVFGQSNNPGLMAKAEASGGTFYKTQDICNGEAVTAFAEDMLADLVYVGADEPLDQGVINTVRKNLPDVMTVGPTLESAQLEADKFFSRQIIEDIDPKYNPTYLKVTTRHRLAEALDAFQQAHLEIVVKPRHLTGGKGVKVMGMHFNTYQEAENYGLIVLADTKQSGLLIEEKIEGNEFTIQAWTDGRTLIAPPATYDYPYREDDDKGPGTGGMATFTMKDGLLPFINQADHDEALEVMRQVLEQLAKRGLGYSGVLYGSFFKTKNGLKVTEFNARGGDPELVNIIELMEPDVDMPDVLTKVATGELSPADVRYQAMASTLIYLVAPDYAYGESDQVYEFEMNLEKILRMDVRAYFAAAECIRNNQYRVGSSRAVALIALDDTPWEARARILQAKASSVDGPLRHRLDPGNKAYIEAMPRAG